MNRNSLITLIAAAVVAIFMAVGESDYEDELREFKHYCNMVEAGHWPDFKKLADECPKDEPTVRVSEDFGTEEW
jgi:hypothetical protein